MNAIEFLCLSFLILRESLEYIVMIDLAIAGISCANCLTIIDGLMAFTLSQDCRFNSSITDNCRWEDDL